MILTSCILPCIFDILKLKVLYISGSIGLGHVIKDLAIVNKLRTINKYVDITWIATNLANYVLASLKGWYRNVITFSKIIRKGILI